ncbi:hypothetical protein GQ55_6G164500 [Panicum hallii var. hallii]|uniref:Uncharacterized protein n=1 Tax=Panicum hallii var. hallii TaxID=1504633 RepID=A0A2T7D6L1_9POAL|nr:hypothetical protein GQ55_6G164500 [Panicum hallii var. hallii]
MVPPSYGRASPGASGDPASTVPPGCPTPAILRHTLAVPGRQPRRPNRYVQSCLCAPPPPFACGLPGDHEATTPSC